MGDRQHERPEPLHGCRSILTAHTHSPAEREPEADEREMDGQRERLQLSGLVELSLSGHQTGGRGWFADFSASSASAVAARTECSVMTR
jgi:hypothetical protein